MIKMNEMPLQFSNMGLFGPNYIPFISSGFVLFEMVPKVRHVSINPKKNKFVERIHFVEEIYNKPCLGNFTKDKYLICEVCKRRAVSALQGTFGSVVKQPAFDEGCRQWPQKRHTY